MGPGSRGPMGALLAISCALLLLPAAHGQPWGVPVWQRAASMEPAVGGLVGMSFEGMRLNAYVSTRLGRIPGAIGTFFPFPITNSSWTWVDLFLRDSAERGLIALITLEPFGGLETVTPEATLELARRIERWERRGAGAKVVLRFAHEMNGGWYIWGQQPKLYRDTFRMVADIIHNNTCRATMMWSPNIGCAYPFAFGQNYSYCANTTMDAEAFAECDSNGDGVVDDGDSFVPYYPGNDYVDWVGLSSYHMADNIVAQPGRFMGIRPNGRATCRSNVLTFYRLFSGDGAWRLQGDNSVIDATPEYAAKVGALTPPRKIMSVSETGARFSMCDFQPPTEKCLAYNGTPSENDIKASWYSQLFSAETIARMPKMRLVQWFDIVKPNDYENNTGDWSLTSNPEIRDTFLNYLQSPEGGSGWWQFTPSDAGNSTNNLCRQYVPGTPSPPAPRVEVPPPAPPIYQWYELRPNHVPGRSMCVTAANQTDPICDLTMSTCTGNATHGASDQVYRLIVAAKNETTTIYNIVDRTGRCATVLDASLVNGAPLGAMPCVEGLASQQFQLSVAGWNLFVVRAVHSGRCMSLPSARIISEGLPLVQMTCFRAAHQVFEFRKL